MEEWINQRLDDLDFILNEMISDTNANAESIKQTLTEATNSVGTTLSDQMLNIWNSDSGLSSVVDKYGTNIFNSLTTVSSTLSSINTLVKSMVDAANKKAADEAAAEAKKVAEQQAAQAQAATQAAQQTTTSTTSTQSSSNTSSWGSWFISKQDSYPKNKLNVD
jgi:hypothetical protein